MHLGMFCFAQSICFVCYKIRFAIVDNAYIIKSVIAECMMFSGNSRSLKNFRSKHSRAWTKCQVLLVVLLMIGIAIIIFNTDSTV